MAQNPNDATIVTQLLPERAELTRRGDTYIIRTDEVACVTAVPTTTAPHVLWNGEAASGKSYVIDRIGWVCTTSAGAASMFQILAVVNQATSATQPTTADTANLISANGGLLSRSLAKTSHTVTVADDFWFPLGPSFVTALTATAGAALEAWVDGGIILKPKGTLGLAVIAANTTAKGKFAIRYHEIQLATQLS